MTKQLSVGAALVFAAWIVWLWVDPLKMDPIKKEIVQKPQLVNEQAKVPEPTQPTVFVLPAPPKPARVVETPKPIVKKVDPKPIVEKKTPPKPKVVVKAKVKPTPKPVPKPEPRVHEVTQTEAVGGRALLRVLEHGKGPQIEIAWPQNARLRDGLYEKFQSCFGMENALMDTDGNLFRDGEPRGSRWEINLDRFSGFLRQVSGRLPQKEARLMDAISDRHGHLDRPVPVRIFPRRVDASLLGGLKAVIGEKYMQARSIQARYDENGLVQDIRLDGRSIKGRVKLAQFKKCSWRL